jgi:hypothetical protein
MSITEKVYNFFKRHGWTQLEWHNNGCFCLSGAASMVVGGLDIDTEHLNDKGREAQECLAKELGFEDSSGMEVWNDIRLRTKREVLDRLRDAIHKQAKKAA